MSDLNTYKSPKRKRKDNEHEHSQSTLPRLQTQIDTLQQRNLRKLSESEATEEDMSPRTIVSTKFQNMEIRSSPTRLRKLSVHEEERPRSDSPSKRVKVEIQVPIRQPMQSEVEVAKTPSIESDTSYVPLPPAMFTFKAGYELASFGKPSPTSASAATPIDQESTVEPNRGRSNTVSDEPTRTPKKRRGSPPPPSPSTSPPSAASRMTDSFEHSTLSQFWWQDEEITGYSPGDPDEDAYGVNGVGYQKTNAEAWRISQKRKQQIADWRNREAKEARAARAGGRRALRKVGTPTGGRSRSGSPLTMRHAEPLASSLHQGSPSDPGAAGHGHRSDRAVRFAVMEV